MRTSLFNRLGLILAIALSLPGALPTAAASGSAPNQIGAQGPSTVYLPLIAKPVPPPVYTCPTTSSNSYSGGEAHQYDGDDPVRPAYNHADKNLQLQGYTPATGGDTRKALIDYGSDEANNGRPANSAPQLTQLFNPNRLPTFVNVYQVYQWNYQPSPTPGTRGNPTTDPPVTALGLQTTAGETLRVPDAPYVEYTIGGGFEVLVLFANANSITLKYTREDSVGPNGYTLKLDNICTDPNLLALYNSLDNSARYSFHGVKDQPGYYGYNYNLPNLEVGKVFGTARSTETIIAIVDSGTTQDPRSCNEWWNDWPSLGGTCLAR